MNSSSEESVELGNPNEKQSLEDEELLHIDPADGPPIWLRIRSALSPKWSAFSRIGGSAVLKTSFIWLFAVPVMAKVFSKLGPDVSIVAFGETWVLHLGLPFSWKLFYFSSVAFTVAMILYEFFCPAIVLKYPTYAQFHEEGKGTRQVRDYFCDILSRRVFSEETAALVSTYLLDFSKEFSDYAEYNTNRLLADIEVTRLVDLMSLVIEAEVPASKTPDAFWYVRSVSDGSSPRIRFLTTVFFALGFVLIAGVVIQNFLYVWGSVFPGWAIL